MSVSRAMLGGCLLLYLSACTFGVPMGDRANNRSASAGSIPKTSKSQYGNPSSYVVFGKRYYVLDNAHGFTQRGVASWYGKKFHGRKTSSGEVYNMYAMTAAHKTLPIPVYVRVENLTNGRSTVVKVNDRGPFVSGRIIDLSYAAAEELGVTGPGTAKVEISVLAPGEDGTRPVTRAIPLTDKVAEDVPLYIQMGSFGTEVNALNLLRELQEAEETVATITELVTDQGLFYRVRIGPLFDIDEVNVAIERLKQKGFSTARIVVQE